jgi:DNA (cytosine-5)-methyltransferase 1
VCAVGKPTANGSGIAVSSGNRITNVHKSTKVKLENVSSNIIRQPPLQQSAVIHSRLSHGSLFSGIGGFDLAAQWMGWNNIFQVEIDKFCQKVLEKNFPDTKRYSDIKKFNGTEYENKIDILTGGLPCQPFSTAGKRRGKDDDRYLWEEMLRVITEVKPTYVVGENVPGIIGLALDTVLSDMENQNYTTETFIIPACAVNAPHRRDRVWFIAYTNSIRWKDGEKEIGKPLHNGNRNDAIKEQSWEQQQCGTGKSNSFFADTNCEHREESLGGDKLGYEGKETLLGRGFYEPDWNREWTAVASELCRVDDGLPKELDKAKRIKALGNAIVPQVAYELFKAIDSVHRRVV